MLQSLLRTICAYSLIFLCFRLQIGQCYLSSPTEWEAYKALFPKNYAELGLTETIARINYNTNMGLIIAHNNRYTAKRESYTLKATQFSDLRWVDVFKLLAPTTPRVASNVSLLPPPSNTAPPAAFDPREELGLIATVQDQGYRCNSGWAYATAKAIELRQAFEMGILAPSVLSAQYLIDCAGAGRGCTNQVPQQTFDFLVNNKMSLVSEESYKNNNSRAEQGMCLAKTAGVASLNEYSRILDGDDVTMRTYLANNYPVIVEFDPTSFEFLHYDKGVFTPPNSNKGSHFMTVIGYGKDAALNKDYWLVQNSFGDKWGDSGFIRIATKWGRNGSLTKSALLPI